MHENRKGAFLIVGVCIVVSVFAFKREQVDDELRGVWKLEWTQTNGQPKYRERRLWAFCDGALVVVGEESTHQFGVSIDPSAIPKHLDTDTPFYPTGIYEVEGDTLRVAQVFTAGMPRPTEFETTSGDMRTVSVFRRLDADPRTPPPELQGLLVSEFGPPREYPERMEFDAEGTPSKDWRQRHAQLDRFSLDQLETLRDIEERFYSRREDLNLLLKRYFERKS